MSNEPFNSNRFTTPLLVVIVSLGAAMRFYGLEAQSLWVDELASWDFSNQGSLAAVIFETANDVHPPGYYIILHFVIKLFGDSEAIMRIPSAIAGTISIVAMFHLARRLYSDKEAIIASALTAVLWCPIFYSQMARAYSFVFLFTILTTISLYSLVRNFRQDTKSPLTILLHVLCSIILIYLHYYGFIIVVFQGGALAAFSLKRGKCFFITIAIYLAIFMAYSPWLPIMVKHSGENLPWFSKPTMSYFLYYIGFFFNKSIELTLMVLVVCLVAFIHTCQKYTKLHDYDSAKDMNRVAEYFSINIMLLAWLFVPFIFVYVYSILCRPALRFYSFMICMPAAYLIFARALCRLPLSNLTSSLVTVGIILLFTWHLVFFMQYYSRPHNEDYFNHPEWAQFREAVGFVVQREDLYRSAVVVGCPNKKFFNYYFDKMIGKKRVTENVCSLQDIVLIEGLIQKNRPSYLWYIFADTKPEASLLSTLAERFSLVEKASFNSAGVYLFRINPTTR